VVGSSRDEPRLPAIVMGGPDRPTPPVRVPAGVPRKLLHEPGREASMLFGKLLPREGNFFGLFDQHAGFIAEGARAFIRLIQHYDDPALREKHAIEVGTAERQADRITAEVNRLLHKTFVTPIDREQIFGLINAMDDIVDLLQDASETMTLYDVKTMNDDILRLGDLSARCCERVQHAVSLLPKISEPHVAEAALKTCEEIDRLESDADRVMRSAMSRLFREENDVRELIKLKAIYEQLESISDRCEDVANLIEGVVLENS
jgi:predicted phosphate transport protein (TIGR00153 family)